MTSRLTTEQLRTQATHHRQNMERFKGPTHITRNAEQQSDFYRAMQETMAEVYEELVERREEMENDKTAAVHGPTSYRRGEG